MMRSDRFFEVSAPLQLGSTVAGKKHRVWVGEYGNPDGIPVVIVHGGPGGGCSDDYANVFPLDQYNIIMIDQRGAGKSMPSALTCLLETKTLEENNTDLLLQDMEHIRKALIGDKRWVVFGGSWGSTLGLLYAIRYPEHVSALILRGIWLGEPEDIELLYEDVPQNVPKWMRPAAWDKFNKIISKHPECYDSLSEFPNLNCYFNILTSDTINQNDKIEAAKAWCAWEGMCSSSSIEKGKELYKQYSEEADPNSKNFVGSMAPIEMFYFINKCFLKPADSILKNISKLANKGIHCVYIVQGSNDFVCPPQGAYRLSQALAKNNINYELTMCDQAGHSFSEPAIQEELSKATRLIAKLLK